MEKKYIIAIAGLGLAGGAYWFYTKNKSKTSTLVVDPSTITSAKLIDAVKNGTVMQTVSSIAKGEPSPNNSAPTGWPPPVLQEMPKQIPASSPPVLEQLLTPAPLPLPMPTPDPVPVVYVPVKAIVNSQSTGVSVATPTCKYAPGQLIRASDGRVFQLDKNCIRHYVSGGVYSKYKFNGALVKNITDAEMSLFNIGNNLEGLGNLFLT